MVKEEVEGCEGRSVTGTYEILVIPKVVAEGARGEFHNFRDVPQTHGGLSPDVVFFWKGSCSQVRRNHLRPSNVYGLQCER